MSLHGKFAVFITTLFLFAALLNHHHNEWYSAQRIEQYTMTSINEPIQGAQRSILRKKKKKNNPIAKLKKKLKTAMDKLHTAQKKFNKAGNTKARGHANHRLKKAERRVSTAEKRLSKAIKG